jgi:8-oxo-dGTP diphosphatase
MAREITKIGLAVFDENRLLLVRKRGSATYILPGGKPEEGEDDTQTLIREIDEELGCRIETSTLSFLGAFSDQAADLPGVRVTVRLYKGTLIGPPSPRSEIDQLFWLSPQVPQRPNLAPSLQNAILPFLSGSTSEWANSEATTDDLQPTPA